MTRFHILSIFPELVENYANASILGRAQESGLISITYTNPRDFATDKHQKVDDRSYGGGPGMVMMVEPLLLALDKISKGIARKKNSQKNSKVKIIMFSPSGKQFTNSYAKNLVKKYTDIVLICGRYEGIDARVKKIFKAEEVSVGPFVLTGGEVPAMIVVDACARQIDGVLGKNESVEENRLASPEVYTRPEVYKWKGKNYKVPSVLLSGHAKNIEEWRTNKLKKASDI